MGRRREPQIKQRLLDACTDYALEHGLPDRLGPLAAAAGTSSRMLIYHFETRDGLLREVLGQARQRQVEAFTDLIRLRPDEPYPTTLARAWSAISGPQGEPYLRMFGRLHHTAGEPLRPGFRRTATTDWLEPLEEGMAVSADLNWQPSCSPSSAACSGTSTPPATPHAPTGPSTTSSPQSIAPDSPEGCCGEFRFPPCSAGARIKTATAALRAGHALWTKAIGRAHFSIRVRSTIRGW